MTNSSSSRRPLIGVLSCSQPRGDEPAQSVLNRYVDAVERALSADVVLLPTMTDLGASLLDRLDGVVLTGSPSNIEASRYGADAASGPFDPPRDRAALRLVQAAMTSQTPVLGICRGLQEINVALGGTLREGLGAPDRAIIHHAPDTATGPALFDWHHKVTVTEGGLLYGKLGRATATVNSAHYQGVARIADELRIEAEADDGIIEAVSARNHPIFAVQWHPECELDDAVSYAVFSIFADLLQKTRKSGVSRKYNESLVSPHDLVTPGVVNGRAP